MSQRESVGARRDGPTPTRAFARRLPSLSLLPGSIDETIVIFPPDATVSWNPPSNLVHTSTSDPPHGACYPNSSAPPCARSVTRAPAPNIGITQRLDCSGDSSGGKKSSGSGDGSGCGCGGDGGGGAKDGNFSVADMGPWAGAAPGSTLTDILDVHDNSSVPGDGTVVDAPIGPGARIAANPPEHGQYHRRDLAERRLHAVLVDGRRPGAPAAGDPLGSCRRSPGPAAARVLSDGRRLATADGGSMDADEAFERGERNFRLVARAADQDISAARQAMPGGIGKSRSCKRSTLQKS